VVFLRSFVNPISLNLASLDSNDERRESLTGESGPWLPAEWLLRFTADEADRRPNPNGREGFGGNGGGEPSGDRV
jgi:hypothetical protein